MKLRRFCAKCGKEIEFTKENLKNFLCKECNQAKYGVNENFVFPKNVKLRRCKICGAFSFWVDNREYPWRFRSKDKSKLDFLTEIIYKDIYTPIEEKEKANYNIFFKQDLDLNQKKDIEYLVRIEKNGIKFEKNQFINRRDIMCKHCASKMSGRFASILQIRVQHEKDEKKMETILEYAQELARKTQLENASHYISAVDVVQNGFDLKLSSQKLLKDLSNSLKKRYNFDFKISKKLMGVDSENGSDLYRFNVSLKLIPVEKNDIFSMDQMQYKVEKVIDNKILARNLTKDNIEQINFENFSKKKWRFLEHERN